MCLLDLECFSNFACYRKTQPGTLKSLSFPRTVLIILSLTSKLTAGCAVCSGSGSIRVKKYLSWESERCLCRFLWCRTVCTAVWHSPWVPHTSPLLLMPGSAHMKTHIILHSLFQITNSPESETMKHMCQEGARSNTILYVRANAELWPAGGIWCALREPWWPWWTHQTTSLQRTAVDTCRTRWPYILSPTECLEQLNEQHHYLRQSNHLRKDIIRGFLL